MTEVINESVTPQISKLENERLNNRKIMWRLVEVTVCLAKCGKPFRGHDESSHSFQKLLFKVFVVLSRYDIVQCFPTFLPPRTTSTIFYRSRTTSILRKLRPFFFAH